MKERKKRKADFKDNEGGDLLKVKKKHKVKYNGDAKGLDEIYAVSRAAKGSQIQDKGNEKDLHVDSRIEKTKKKKPPKEKKNRDQSVSDLSVARDFISNETGKVVDSTICDNMTDGGKKKRSKEDKKSNFDAAMGDASDQKEIENERETVSGSPKRANKNKKKVDDAQTKYVDEGINSELMGNTKDSVKLTQNKRKDKRYDEDFEVEESAKNSCKHKKKKRKTKEIDDLVTDSNSEKSSRKAEKKKKKLKKQSKMAETENPSSYGSAKKVSFSDHVDVFPLFGNSDADEKYQEDKREEDGLVRGKRFSKEEDELVKNAVMNYIEAHSLGEDGVDMIMRCHAHPETRGCWKDIGASIPWRPQESIYYRAHILFERSSNRSWTPEELERVKWFAEKHGSDWRSLGDEFGKHRLHVKDAWRRIKYPNLKKGRWARDEYQTLFDLVNTDLRMKIFEEKKSKHGMLRDNIPWTAISNKLETRNHSLCCMKWYNQLTSSMVAEGLWDNSDDYRLLDALLKLDACCIEDVDWDNLLENRSGDVCRKRWNQMVPHIGKPVSMSFPEQVDILTNRYCPELAEVREEFDNRPRV